MNLHIDRYIMVNMQGLQQLVDAVGGITVNNTLGFPISISDQEEFNTISIGVGEQTIMEKKRLFIHACVIRPRRRLWSSKTSA